MDVCIKNIGEQEWSMFRAETIKHKLKTGEFFNKVIQEHLAHCSNNNWDKILHGEKRIKNLVSKDDLPKIRAEFRERLKMRI